MQNMCTQRTFMLYTYQASTAEANADEMGNVRVGSSSQREGSARMKNWKTLAMEASDALWLGMPLLAVQKRDHP